MCAFCDGAHKSLANPFVIAAGHSYHADIEIIFW
ncbi:hypothetical protein O206_08995 [Ochrobactrum sp. EGD-AQ16]|uniref:Uncharacterized protein n=1 Tax=Brucella intermedia 229E TaxID=1337887 RepID=U4V8K8_9HYPH|nr:hypothetical protein O206_08995 [Ochrobactrum sp. EGD-AQ16]ERM01333.1 hypothetical protein Q644_22230 [Brucella intermedia 229E]